MTTPKIGNAKYGSDYVKRKYWKLKDGEASYRILPPIGELAEDGKWSQFWNVHYGYRNSKGEMRVFQSPLVKNRKTKMVEVPDAALERIEMLKSEFEKAKAGLKVNPADKKLAAAYEKLMELVGGQKAKYNLDNNHYVNAMNEHGEIGVLKLRHKAKLALDQEIKRLRENNIDPLSVDQGRYFVFRRSGMALETTFKVDVKQKEFDIPGVGRVKQDIVHTLTPEIIARLGKEAAELDKLYKRPTSDEVARIVKESNLLTGNSVAVDEILDKKADNSNTFEEGDDAEETAAAPATSVDPGLAALLSSTPPPAQQAAPVAQAPAAQAPVAQAPVAQAPQAAPVETSLASSAPKNTAQALTEMSDEDFLKQLGM